MSPDSGLDRIILVTLCRKAPFRPLTNVFPVNVVKRSLVRSLNMHLWVCSVKWGCAGIWKFLPFLLEKRLVLAAMCNNSYVTHILFPHGMTVVQLHSNSNFVFVCHLTPLLLIPHSWPVKLPDHHASSLILPYMPCLTVPVSLPTSDTARVSYLALPQPQCPFALHCLFLSFQPLFKNLVSQSSTSCQQSKVQTL